MIFLYLKTEIIRTSQEQAPGFREKIFVPDFNETADRPGFVLHQTSV
jgi:hypothetical protein